MKILLLIAVSCGTIHAFGECTTASDKVDCGFYGIDESQCESRGCCYSETDQSEVPWCFFPAASKYFLADDYVLDNTGLTGTLISSDVGDSAIKELNFTVTFESSSTARVLITDKNSERWQIPENIVPSGGFNFHKVEGLGNDELDYSLNFTQAPFTFTLVRDYDGAVLFDSSSLVFEDQYIELYTAFDPESSLFGLGEVTRSALPLVPGTTTTLWARDMPACVFDQNLYGSHPFFMSLSPTGSASGAFLRNSNGMDVDYSAQGDSLTFKVIGGVIDLWVFAGSDPVSVAAQYTEVIGRPSMMPYWSLGFHQCRYGYTNVSEVEAVRQGYLDAEIPLDTVWMDIDYMEQWKDWTFDEVNFNIAEVTSFVDGMHSDGQHFVVIVDPGILAVDASWNTSYPPYTNGLKDDVFVKDGFTGEPYMTQVWPGPTLMPDWFHPNVSEYWTESIRTFHSTVAFDGLWTDMNEVSNFCNDNGLGQVCENSDPSRCPTLDLSTQTQCCLSCRVVDSDDLFDYPPYAINNDADHVALGHKTLPMSALHYSGGDTPLKEYDVHNLFGLMEARLTAEALSEVRQRRPFVLSRSTFPSHGTHAAHWTGDNKATWEDLNAASITVMNMALFGIPMVGSDICGFIDDTTEELCARWIEIGAFHPFSRNHNTIGAIPQELYRWDSVAEASRAALGLRYQLLPMFYTALHEAHTTGALVVRPLWANYPADPETHGISSQFMVSSSVLVSPALSEGQTTVRAYLPGDGKWFSLFDHTMVDSGSYMEFPTPLTVTNVHVRSGTILPMHDTKDGVLTTVQAKATPYRLLVALDPESLDFVATGSVFLDDGEQVSVQLWTQVEYTCSADTLSSKVTQDTYPDAVEATLGSVVVLGLSSCPSSITLTIGGISQAPSPTFVYDADFLRLTIKVLIPMNSDFVVTWV